VVEVVGMSVRDDEYVICPFCGREHGDASEWCASEDVQRVNCDECGKEFVCHAEYSVQYVSRAPLSERDREIYSKALGRKVGT
jgi:transposase-like protein